MADPGPKGPGEAEDPDLIIEDEEEPCDDLLAEDELDLDDGDFDLDDAELDFGRM
jgi:hypothetical protein